MTAEGPDFADRIANYSRRARQLQKLSASRRRLRHGAAYASAAGAALAGASAAEATIVWSSVQNVVAQIGGNGPSSFSTQYLNFGPAPIPLGMSVFRVPATQNARFFRQNLNFQFAGNSGGSPIHFSFGNSITATQFNASVAILADKFGGNNFAEATTGFLGFTFNGNKGWIKVRWEEVATGLNDGKPDKVTAFEWAYEDSGGPINAGQTAAAAVPEAGAAALVGLVACGCAGVMALKKLRNTA